MAATVLQTFSQRSRVLYPGADVAAATITKPVPTKTRPDPTAGGILEISGEDGGAAPAAVKMQFFGKDTDAQTMVAAVYGWEFIPSDDNVHYNQWVPTLLFNLTAITLDSGMPGVAGTQVPAAYLYATAITLGATGNSGVSVEVVSPGHGNDIAHVLFSVKGAFFLECRLATGSSAVGCNGLWKVL